jgi:hypothetical protein
LKKKKSKNSPAFQKNKPSKFQKTLGFLGKADELFKNDKRAFAKIMGIG